MMRLRLALTITGGVSLGTFEAGAVAALIGGTSAGAITGLLAARSLLEGFDPIRALTHTDWTAIEFRRGLDVAAFTEPAGGSVLDAVFASAAPWT